MILIHRHVSNSYISDVNDFLFLLDLLMFIYSFIYLFIYFFIYLFIYFFIYLFIYFFFYLFFCLIFLDIFSNRVLCISCLNYSGIVVSIVPRRHRPVSSSLSLVVFNLFGYFLSLVLSGYLMQVRTVLTNRVVQCVHTNVIIVILLHCNNLCRQL